MNKNIADFRENYKLGSLHHEDLDDNPMTQFEQWINDAISAKVKEPNAMTLATVNKDGGASARIVLLKGIKPDGFIFYTNYESRKGQELDHNPKAALVFNWLELERQIRIEGTVKKISAEDSAAYFHSRPQGSQIGAWCSPQSQVIENRTVLDENLEKYTSKFEAIKEVPLPPFWGGYILQPNLIEFWQGRSSRLHDRFEYKKVENGRWERNRLAP